MGVYLSEPAKEKKFNQGCKKGVSFCSAEMQGWRRNMQDAAIFSLDIGDGNSLFAVFDGHGGNIVTHLGSQVSKYVQKIFIDELKSLEFYKKKDYSKALDEAFQRVDEKISSPQGNSFLRGYRQNSDQYDDISLGTGCTGNVVLITPTKYYIANAGDSRSVLCRSGKAIDLSFDHKPQNEEQEARIRKAGGYIQMGRVNGGLNLSRSFGDFNYKRNNNLSYAQQMITCKPDIQVVDRDSSDEFIIVGCDGIWQQYVENSQGLIDIIKLQLKSKKDSKVIMQNLLNDLLARDTTMGIGCDNMTAILIKLNQ